MFDYFKKQLEETPRREGNRPYEDRFYRSYVAMFRDFKRLHRERGVPQTLIDQLLKLDHLVDAKDPDAMTGIHALHRKVRRELNMNKNNELPIYSNKSLEERG